MRAFYEAAAAQLNRRPLYTGVYLTDADHHALVRHLASRYREHVAFEESRGSPVRAAA